MEAVQLEQHRAIVDVIAARDHHTQHLIRGEQRQVERGVNSASRVCGLQRSPFPERQIEEKS